MAKLREMSLRGGGAMHKQTMIHHKMHKNTQDLHAVKETHKHTNTTWSNERRGKGEESQQSTLLRTGRLCPPPISWDITDCNCISKPSRGTE